MGFHIVGRGLGIIGGCFESITDPRYRLGGLPAAPLQSLGGIVGHPHSPGHCISTHPPRPLHRLYPFDHGIDLGLVPGLAKGFGQCLLTGRRARSGVLHQGIQGAEGLLKTGPDAAIGLLEVHPHRLVGLSQLGGAIGGGLFRYGVNFAQIVTGLLGLDP
ncbi:hypothetical protein D3C85_1129010 [compost metagenome]